MDDLTADDLGVILESLNRSLQRIRCYQDHPSYEFKQGGLERLENVKRKIMALKP